ncbi:MAG: hypothetical protein N4A70_01755 [Pelagimonas sp.]|jgi:hypothetical protein|nr:hypothetical protein [Pelagimonas sp.]
MQISFSPMRCDQTLRVDRQGDVLTLNGEVFDFTPLPEGSELPEAAIGSLWFAGPVRRGPQGLSLTLLLPHGEEAPQAVLFPQPITVDRDGPVALPGQEESA